VPIEINPSRFGGFSLADLTLHAYGFSPYKYFFENKKPDWETICKEKEGQHFGWILAYNANNMSLSEFEPDHEKFKGTLSEILYYNRIDHMKNPVFATVYAKTKNLDEFFKFLNFDFGEYFKRVEGSTEG
jgi:hypothetical protein